MTADRDFTVAATLDITARECPITFVVTKLKLEELSPGEVLAVTLRAGEALRNVPRSLKEQGHTVLAVEPLPDELYRLYVRRGAE